MLPDMTCPECGTDNNTHKLACSRADARARLNVPLHHLRAVLKEVKDFYREERKAVQESLGLKAEKRVQELEQENLKLRNEKSNLTKQLADVNQKLADLKAVLNR